MNIKILMIILGIIAAICVGAIIAVFKHTDRNPLTVYCIRT